MEGGREKPSLFLMKGGLNQLHILLRISLGLIKMKNLTLIITTALFIFISTMIMYSLEPDNFESLLNTFYFTTNAITRNIKYRKPPASAIRFAVPFMEGESPRRKKFMAIRSHVRACPQRKTKKRKPVVTARAFWGQTKE